MKVAELMKTDLKTVSADATVADAVILLAESHISGLPVVDHRDRLVGVVTTSDVLQALAEASSPEERERVFEVTEVREIMTPRPLTVEGTTEVMAAVRQMLYLEVHRLFVEEDGQLAGVLSQTDIVAAVATAKI
jgi:CBS domain-containing membrane protein